MSEKRITEILRRAEFELALSGEQRLADQVASIRHGTCALVRAVKLEREAATSAVQQAARNEVISALSDLEREPARHAAAFRGDPTVSDDDTPTPAYIERMRNATADISHHAANPEYDD